MQENNHKQIEIINCINSANRMLIASGFHERSGAMTQIACLLGYKYLSNNISNNSEDIGYELNEEFRYEKLLINKGDVIELLKLGIEQITHNNNSIQASDVFFDLFDMIDFDRFNKNESWLTFIDVVEKICSETTATIGEIMMVMIKYLSNDKRRDFIFMLTEDSIKLITANQKDVTNIYDPFADDGTLLAQIGNVINVENYYGQHPNPEKCIMAKMTLLTNDINYKNIFIKCNDIIEPIHWNVKFDLGVTISPFGIKGGRFNEMDVRFGNFAHKRLSEISYLLDMFYNLEDDGTIRIIVPDAVLRLSSNKKIFQYLVDNEFISTIIGLPGGLFGANGVLTALLIINKTPKNKGIFYLNLRNAKTRRLWRKSLVNIDDIDNYIKILSNEEEIELTSNTATIEDIKENDYNLAINRYVDSEKLEEIDIEQTIANIKAIKKELKQVDEELNTKLGGLLK